MHKSIRWEGLIFGATHTPARAPGRCWWRPSTPGRGHRAAPAPGPLLAARRGGLVTGRKKTELGNSLGGLVSSQIRSSWLDTWGREHVDHPSNYTSNYNSRMMEEWHAGAKVHGNLHQGLPWGPKRRWLDTCGSGTLAIPLESWYPLTDPRGFRCFRPQAWPCVGGAPARPAPHPPPRLTPARGEGGCIISLLFLVMFV